MNEQQVREIAEAAFKRHFGDVGIVRINIRQRLDFEDDPAVDVNIIYDDESGQVTGRGFLGVLSEVVDKTWREGKDDLGYPYLRLIAKSDIGQPKERVEMSRAPERLKHKLMTEIRMSGETMKAPVVVAVINLKGGVGKTTVVALLARYAARKGLNVLAVDLDPQANLSQALMTEREYMQFMQKGEPSIVELFNGYLPPSLDRASPAPLDQIIRKVGDRENFHLIPSRFDFSDNLISSIRVDERVLARYIADNEMRRDLILIDCAPTESILTRTAYHASRHVLVPVKTEFFSTIGFPLLRESLNQFKSDHPSHAIDVCGVLINYSETRYSPMGPHHRDAQRDIHEKAEEYEWPVMRNHMSHSRGYPKLMKEEYPSDTRNAEPEFRRIAEEFMKMSNLLQKEE